MSTWQDINLELDDILGDDNAVSYRSSLRISSFNRAQQYFAVTHTAIFESATGLATSGSVSYPADMFLLSAVENYDDHYFLEPVSMIPGRDVPETGFMDTGTNIKIFNTDMVTANIWYYKYYPRVVDTTSTITLPPWAEWGVVNLSVAYMLNPKMVSQADLRSFQTKRDAGNPEDNPPKALARHYLAVYQEIIAAGPPRQDRYFLYRPGVG